MKKWTSILFVALTVVTSPSVAQHVVNTRVAILGGGMTGIIAARTLNQEGIDFVLVEARNELGGRMQDVTLNNGVTVELGPNWVQGLGEGATQNPIFTLALENNLRSVFSDFDNLTTFDNHGPVDMEEQLDRFDDAFASFLSGAGDLTARAGLSVTGYRPLTSLDDAAEYYTMDFEYAQPPEETSFLAAAENNNFTFNGFSSENNLVVDQRGFKVIAQATAAKFLKASDPRLLLNHTVTQIVYSSNGVTIHTQQGVTINADYAICTFSVGVLQNNDVTFSPPLPDWKQEAIDGMNMYQIYADPSKRGFYTVWQSLDLPNFLPGSHVLFVTVTDRESIRIERQNDAETQAEIMSVLRSMYGPDIPEPTQFLFKRWHADPLFRGTYSNWGPSYSPGVFDDLRAPVGTRLWFAGEATSFKYYGFLQGAFTEGQSAATLIAQCIFGNCSVTPASASGHMVVPACGKTFLEEDPVLIF
ncbi:hypothetical protein Clacol_009784 [Clathrus columnatus]|uniref:Amine oxidase domain-containing protein n=1 Tax=Clathrus columnatus TaxID=1419009 RepID=A0AAV5ARS2_9AGAM|nr:hypothetical protein Clacol_009784 [Clathrus columnatus]